MDNIAKLCASPIPVDFAGDTYYLAPLTLRDWGVIENYLIRKCRDEKREVATTAREHLDRKAWDGVVKRVATECAEITEISSAVVRLWCDTIEGVAFILWLAFWNVYGADSPYRRGDVERLVKEMDQESVEFALLIRSVGELTTLHACERDFENLDAMAKKLERVRKESDKRGKGKAKKATEGDGPNWRLFVATLCAPPILGGRGMSMKEVTGMTLYQARLFTYQLESFTGSRKLPIGDARQVANTQHGDRPGKKVKHLDMVEAQKRIYREFHGEEPPAEVVARWEELVEEEREKKEAARRRQAKKRQERLGH